MRRSGKSTLFELFKNNLREQGVADEQLIHLNFEDLANYHLRDFLALHEYILGRLVANKQSYVFLDEIQHVEQFEEAVRSLNLRPDIDLYITGSNAYFMSGDLATLLAGRYIQLEILPLSFKEFCSAPANADLNPTQAYELFRVSAFPFLVGQTQRQQRNEYVRAIYNDIVVKDIVTRHKITEQRLLERVLQFLMGAIGSEISVNKITNTIKSSGVAISNATIERFVDAFIDGLIVYNVPRYDIKGKKPLERLEKYYAVDLGFRELLVPSAVGDEGHILENIIYLELRRRYTQVYVGRSDKYEVDFVCLDDQSRPSYYQVALQTLDEAVLARELRSLQAIKDHYPKYLITLDSIGQTRDFQGIQKRYALDWLLS